ncbi:MAG: Penicillin-binding protein 2 [Candidatus Amesbacteria bacterium GW2011_GWC1_48_10]|uniref:Penicillin-binding protein 2 n=1 Tax=Candidatus Amesbacteria bacterium GW2011_GWC1_48_10 TaxID=1618365 RepID=A0A0G1UKN5_9BACT|nr:MAG: Penicillin-binding protein 2 [Candidatus Amesbacteria bacterium GW2011_GWC1_48_10]
MKRFRPGVSFGDFVVKDSSTRKSRVPPETEADYRRDENRIKQIRLAAPRGVIFDRNGTAIAGNEPAVQKDEATGLETPSWQRRYFLGEAGAHILGYLGEVSQDEVGLLREAGRKYEPKSRIGRTGLEEGYEEKIRGKDGGRLVEVDSAGQVVRELGYRKPTAGDELRLTTDADLQKAAYDAFGFRPERILKGAAVASIPGTGEILALVSSPSFDPNLFINGQADGVAGVLNNPELPMFNRGLGGLYPPGSTFKMVTMAAALASGKVNSGFTFADTGVIRVGSYSYSNWLFNKRGQTEGVVGFVRAMSRSTDTFFYKVGEMTTPEVMAQWAKDLGLGQKTGVEIYGEAGGLIPDPQWKELEKGEKWWLGNTYHMAIGQGDILVTPVQMNLVTNVIASGGRKCRPHLINESMNDGQLPMNDAVTQCPNIKIPKETLKLIREGMIGACSPGGTAFPLFDWNEAAIQSKSKSLYADRGDQQLPVIACKTGTAEYVAADGRVLAHGWLTAFVPADDPQISVTVVVEGGGEGSNVAAPIVRKILAKYFSVEDSYPYSAIPQEVGE